MNRSISVASIPDEALPPINKLKGDLKTIAELSSVRTSLTIAEAFEGTPIRCYGVKKIKLRWRNSCIRNMADNGTSVVRLSRMFGLSDRHIKNIIGSIN